VPPDLRNVAPIWLSKVPGVDIHQRRAVAGNIETAAGQISQAAAARRHRRRSCPSGDRPLFCTFAETALIHFVLLLLQTLFAP